MRKPLSNFKYHFVDDLRWRNIYQLHYNSRTVDQHIAHYMDELDAYDAEEGRKLSKEDLEHKLENCKERKELYEGYREQLEQSGEKQMSFLMLTRIFLRMSKLSKRRHMWQISQTQTY